MKLLFLCTGNSCRSQMAEGWARSILGDAWEVSSAGLHAKGVDPQAVAAMAEAGVDISNQTSKGLEAVAAFAPDWVVTVCGHADENCPVLPGATRKLHAPFDDPPRLAEGLQSDQALEVYRRVRDEIRGFVMGLEERLAADESKGK